MLLRKPIRVHDGRALDPAPDLEAHGFQLYRSPLQVRDGDVATTRFLAQFADLVEAATGCRFARVLQYLRRNGHQGLPAGQARGFRPSDTGNVRGYASRVHGDFCPYVEDLLDGHTDGRHFAIFNAWRSMDLDAEIEVMPLALCDMNTVSADEMVCADGWRTTEPRTRVVTYRLIHAAAQCWYYFPKMTSDEVLVFKQYDTRCEEANRRTAFHTPFADPGTREDAPLRRTIEVRVLAVFDEEDEDRESRKARFQAEVPSVRLDGTVSDWRDEESIDWVNRRGASPAVLEAEDSR